MEIEPDILKSIEFNTSHILQVLHDMGAYQFLAQEKEIKRLKKKCDILLRRICRLGPVVSQRVMTKSLKELAPECKFHSPLYREELIEILKECK